MMFMELYYEHCNDRYWDAEEKSLPYAIRIPDEEERADFGKMLSREGFLCVNDINRYLVIYVNLDLMRWGSAAKACWSSCVDNRLYTKEDFMGDIFNPWKQQNKK